MVLTGIIDRSLGQLCLRGFAPIKELARISKADYEYQRDILDKQQAIISNFLETEKHLFFPEVILSFKFKMKLEFLEKNKQTPLQFIELGKPFSSQNRNVSLKFTPSKNFDFKQAELQIENTFLNELISSNNHPFHRIDGNHRLSASEETNSSFIDNLKIPFCIILGQEFYDENGVVANEDSENFDKSVQVYFHNINTKTIPLTSEENLKGIINNTKRFTDEEVTEIVKTDGKLVRKIISETKEFSVYPNVKHIITGNEKTFTVSLINLLIDYKKVRKTGLISRVQNALSHTNTILADTDINFNPTILLSLVYYLTTIKDAKHFLLWVKNHRIDFIEYISEYNIIDLFEEYAKSEIKVFVAMPFFDGDADVVQEFNTIYDNAIKEIAQKHQIRISLYPIMQNKGATQDQIQDIINKIQNCGIFIGDISDNNANVLYETGWARALNKHTILVREKDSTKPKSDYSNDTYHSYKKSALTVSLTKIVNENILDILKAKYGFVID
ncbi:hypothetical protein HUE46_04355 [Flavobacterium columnare]|uniref:hypothetical protein n=1 Tax=Flavobacterium columnare TaxID=996 RepID=UPI001784C5FE|nr:hypothetical protein [Flavobacterium columnare]QOG89305.1 hypothetical protein HUE41_04355 [Flavobacterium columnare]QOG91964.1 hypothetical protein HUE42_04350 [Flavobacterium columnare]QOG94628.1 hypothetical protein HUE43_04355 [Flavobacterium columnare]QOG97287.1 hypothetical protein HUE44_04350 [Flavobacterium columnare]QOG99945.1 hypothetical protein HUE45_04350 [Flavobacterium columnare]